ncbi:hypothetical protein, partial [Chryseobacterium sp. CH1]|uniref:hypothetical protein n=1 Tax=Chryseobacterium sp. CH1 TaxID=713551 RepID=UPI001027046D
GNYVSTTDDLYSFSQQLILGKNLRKDLVLIMFGKDSQLVQAGGRPGYRAYYYQNLKSGNYVSTTDDLYSFSQQLILGKNLRKDLVLIMFG